MEFLSRFSREWVVAFLLALLITVGYLVAFAPPANFPVGSTVRVTHGDSVPEIAQNLAEAHVITHPTIFRAVLRLAGTSGNVQSGLYSFKKPESLIVVAYRLVAGDYGLPPVRMTFIEGVTVREAAAQIENAFSDISAQDFVRMAKKDEGFLFPDTYFFQPGADAEAIITVMRSNFEKKIASMADDISASGRPLSEIVTMASLVEKEARTSEARRMVAGILWNRLERGMPLQVDAVFGYIFERTTYSPSFADLKVDSPYNTYTHVGLPPGPICNPGLDALLAVAHPAKTKYLYYLTGKDNLMHYATTYAEHQANQKKYLR
ncbi:MAG: endolytic transglycosylase MltG [Candidatus Paceibacterota bacterium]|jgi:UPF0755 protein